ncbi:MULTISPECIES: sensor histidine kinase KdpD [Microbacterium]|uniref:sensor histidine kinase n=1 Tax=Microbacterium TaxID=33882 RepID=UPI002786D6E4|nr:MULTISPECIES: HAMP domain-containing sensor histidine kinase [Microbacterium]MDQ1074265.1 two-component system OmpR family sensor kinase [Microbacterium sp. SORGH_AS_0969]MDQ1114492.1 two-component system OmpR family sensor kinase [Microbacterium testaceum]
MSRRTAALAIALPVSLAAIAALVLFVAGERRALTVSTALPLVVVYVGVALTVVAAVIVALTARRGRARAARDLARDKGYRAGRDDERDAHRRFLARLDHELKNPITAIRATLAGVDPATAPAHVEVIDAQARRLAALVGDLRKLSEIETRPLETEPVDLEALARDAVHAIEQQRPEARGRISVIAERVPWPVPVLPGDPDLLALALDNVLANAVKFSASGPIEVRLREDGGWAVIEVADTGRGVPADAQAVVFDDLARAANARDVPGSGIGLSLVRTILHRHGGDVELRSREGAGTVVTLRLPTA